MVTLEFSRKQGGRQQRSRRTATYTAPSGAEYTVNVVKVDTTDQTVQVDYEWSPGKFYRMWVGTRDLSGFGVLS